MQAVLNTCLYISKRKYEELYIWESQQTIASHYNRYKGRLQSIVWEGSQPGGNKYLEE